MLIDRLIHPSLKSDTEYWYRARVLVGVCVVYMTIILSTAFYIGFLAPLSAHSSLVTTIALLVLAGIYGAVLWLLKHRGAYELCCHIASGFTAAAIALGVIVSGGPVLSPATPVNVVPVILAFVLLGKRAGLIWAQGVLSVHALMMVLGFFVDYPQFLDTDHMEVHHLYHWVVTYSAIIGLMIVFDSINSRLKKERNAERERFAYLASHDPLTDLANRTQFEEKLDRAMANAGSKGTMTALFFIDLDGFKPINDTWGHDVGDRVLRVVSNRLRQHMRVHDTIARLGGDEFAVIVEDLHDELMLQQIADKVLELVNEPIEGIPPENSISASIGVALCPSHTRDRQRLVKYADEAMYRAKRVKNSWCLHVPSLEHDIK